MRLNCICCVLLLASVSASAQAQQFRKVRLGIGFAYASLVKEYPNNSNTWGLGMYLEPSYRVKDNIAVGLRYEGTVTSGKEFACGGLHGQYYLSDKPWRPFVGLGVGMIHAGLLAGDVPNSHTYSSREEATTFMAYPHIGFDYGHFSLTIDYTLAVKSKALIYYNTVPFTPPYTDKLNNSYLSIKAGFFFGGGRKKK